MYLIEIYRSILAKLESFDSFSFKKKGSNLIIKRYKLTRIHSWRNIWRLPIIVHLERRVGKGKEERRCVLSNEDEARKRKRKSRILDTSLATVKELPCERFPNNRSAVYFEFGSGPTKLWRGGSRPGERSETKKERVGEKGRQAKGRTSANVSVAAP